MNQPGRSVSLTSLNVVLVEPEIPPNTGSIARLCGATNSILHLIHPLGFKVDDKNLRRAGLDYWSNIIVRHHRDFKTFMFESAGGDFFYFSTRGKHIYTEAEFTPGCYLVFGKETEGLPHSLLEENIERSFYLPIWGKVRSLNLSNAVGIALYEAYRRLEIWK
ncbi:MAG: tRNA (cytidine(34)-2'-O)-methyltransferase [Dissulfuribacterales bacterium]